MRRWAPVLLLAVFAAGCAPKVTVNALVDDFSPRNEDCAILSLSEGETPFRAMEKIAEIGVGDTGMTIQCGFWDVYWALSRRACAVGGELLHVTEIKEPNLLTSCFRMKGDVYRFTEDWDVLPVDADSVMAQVDALGEDADPIVGLWDVTDQWQTLSRAEGSFVDSAGMEFRISILPDGKSGDEVLYRVAVMTDADVFWPAGSFKGFLKPTDEERVYEAMWFDRAFVERNFPVRISMKGRAAVTVDWEHDDGDVESREVMTMEQVYP